VPLPVPGGPFPIGSRVRCKLPVEGVVRLTGTVLGIVLADVTVPPPARAELPLWRVWMENLWVCESRPDVRIGAEPSENGPWEHAVVRLGFEDLELIAR
jgi:hypothetical protein